MLWVALAVYLSAAVISGILAATETAVLMLSAGRVHRIVEADKPGALTLERLSDDRHRLRAVAAFVSGATYATASVFGFLVGADFGASGMTLLPSSVSTVWSALSSLVGGIVAVLVTHALTQALPRTFAVTSPERIALAGAPVALPTMRLLYPLVRALGAPWKWAVSVAGAEREISPWAVTPEWRAAESDDEESEREEAEEALLEAVSDFAEKVAREVMVPRTDIKALPDTATATEAVALIAQSGFTRLPVYHDTVDDIRGILYAKDLLAHLARGVGERSVFEIARQPYFVPETKPVEELLREMRSKTHIAIVADEYGGTAGLVTLEDLLEEIVGDISDEYDREEPLVVEVAAGVWRVDARLPVDDLNELIGTDFDPDTDSVGGLFSEVAGRIPEQGESVEIEGVRLTVTQLEGTRIRELTVEPVSSAPEGADDE